MMLDFKSLSILQTNISKNVINSLRKLMKLFDFIIFNLFRKFIFPYFNKNKFKIHILIIVYNKQTSHFNFYLFIARKFEKVA